MKNADTPGVQIFPIGCTVFFTSVVAEHNGEESMWFQSPLWEARNGYRRIISNCKLHIILMLYFFPFRFSCLLCLILVLVFVDVLLFSCFDHMCCVLLIQVTWKCDHCGKIVFKGTQFKAQYARIHLAADQSNGLCSNLCTADDILVPSA